MITAIYLAAAFSLAFLPTNFVQALDNGVARLPGKFIWTVTQLSHQRRLVVLGYNSEQ